MMKKITIADDFSDEPAGRYYSDGRYSGERFRKEFLVDTLKCNEKVTIDFDRTEGYGSSFLEEAFGGLISKEGFLSQNLHNQFLFISNEDASVIKEVWSYIDTAIPKVKDAK